MSQIDELTTKRFQFLNLLLEKSGGNTLKRFNLPDLSKELGLSDEERDNIVQYLCTEKLIDAYHHSIRIRHEGINAIDSALSKPEQASHYNIINIDHMEASQIQQGTVGSTQSSTFNLNIKNDIESFVKTIDEKLSELELSIDDKSEIKADITTIESQISSSRPKCPILRESLISIKKILESAGGAVVAQQLIPRIPPLLDSLRNAF